MSLNENELSPTYQFGPDPWGVKHFLVTDTQYSVNKAGAKALLDGFSEKAPELSLRAPTAPQLEPLMVALGTSASELDIFTKQFGITLEKMKTFFEEVCYELDRVNHPVQEFMRETPENVKNGIFNSLNSLIKGGTKDRFAKYKMEDMESYIQEERSSELSNLPSGHAKYATSEERLREIFLEGVTEYAGIHKAGEFCSCILNTLKFGEIMEALVEGQKKGQQASKEEKWAVYRTEQDLRDAVQFLKEQTDVLYVGHLLQKKPEDKLEFLRYYLAAMKGRL